MKVAIYARVSTDGQSVNAQLADLRETADRRGWEIVNSRKPSESPVGDEVVDRRRKSSARTDTDLT